MGMLKWSMRLMGTHPQTNKDKLSWVYHYTDNQSQQSNHTDRPPVLDLGNSGSNNTPHPPPQLTKNTKAGGKGFTWSYLAVCTWESKGVFVSYPHCQAGTLCVWTWVCFTGISVTRPSISDRPICVQESCLLIPCQRAAAAECPHAATLPDELWKREKTLYSLFCLHDPTSSW